MYEKEAYFHQLKEKIDNDTMEECQDFMKRAVEARHQRVLEQQRLSLSLCTNEKQV